MDGDENPFRFSSEYYDDETGLVYYNYRYYSPRLGRWTKRDPIEEEGGVNLYAMVENNSLNKVDAKGLDTYTDAIINLELQKLINQWKQEARNKFPQIQEEANCILKALLELWKEAKNDPMIQKNFDFKENADWFKNAAEYYLKNYSSPKNWNVDGISIGGKGFNPIIMDPSISSDDFDDNIIQILKTLIHEPQHNLSQEGPGHRIKVSGSYKDLDAVISDSLAALAHYAGNQKLKGCCKKTNTPIKNLWDKIQCDCKRIFK